MTVIRVFFAFDLSKDLKLTAERILLNTQQTDFFHLFHWTEVTDLHMTLWFFPKFASTDLLKLITNVKNNLKNISTFSLTLNKLIYFPSNENPNIISFQVEMNPAIHQLIRKLNQGIIETGYPIETRDFKGHVTLARRIKHHQELFSLPVISPISIPIDAITLYQSQCLNKKSIYTILHKIPLKKFDKS